MDKNTLKMVLVMGLVIFAFTFIFKKPHPQQNTDATASTEAVENSTEVTIDSIYAAEAAHAPEWIAAAGTVDPETGVVSFHHANVDLTADNGTVSGTVAMPDGTTLAYEQIVAKQWPEGMTQSQKNAAVGAVREALTTAGRYGSFARHLSAGDIDDEPVVLAAPDSTLVMQISRKGGYIAAAELPRYKTYFANPDDPERVDTANVVLFNQAATSNFNFTLRTADLAQINSADLYFTPRQVNDSTLEMIVDLGGGAEWGFRYTTHPATYIVTLDIIQRNMAGRLSPGMGSTDFSWVQTMRRQERGRTFEERNSGIYYKLTGDKPDDFNGMKSTSKNISNHLEWIAFKNQFFSMVFIPRDGFDSAEMSQRVLNDDPTYVKYLTAESSIAYDPNKEVGASADIFMGPNLYSLLRGIDDEVASDDLYLTRLIPLGWSWLRWINTLIIIPIFNFLSGLGLNYGIIILLLTIIIKIILFPFTYKSYMSQAKMRVLAPEVKAINEKYPNKEDAMKRQQETMALYNRAGASPLSGCLPLLLQMPILIAMFSFFPSCIELRGQSFLWAQDLAAPDVICTLPFKIPFYGNHVSLFCLLMTVTNVIYTRINMKSQPSQSNMPGMKWMMYLMPLMFLFFFNDYAAALSYYYFLSLLITIIQTYIFRRCINEDKLRAKMRENAAKPRKKSGFMARLEEAQRRQQAMLREQEKQRRGRR